jgi:hypothetical protein
MGEEVKRKTKTWRVKMNAKKMFKKMFGKTLQIVALVAVAALLTAGGVAADHGVAPVHAHRTTRVRYEQYLSALDETVNAAPVPASQITRVRFEQYREALNGMEQSRFPSSSVSAVDLRMRRMDSFGQYLAALDWMEAERSAAYAAEASRRGKKGIATFNPAAFASEGAALRAKRMAGFTQYLAEFEALERASFEEYVTSRTLEGLPGIPTFEIATLVP